jgi:hypothetical protein
MTREALSLRTLTLSALEQFCAGGELTDAELVDIAEYVEAKVWVAEGELVVRRGELEVRVALSDFGILDLTEVDAVSADEWPDDLVPEIGVDSDRG